MGSLRILLANETYPPDTNGSAIFTQRLARGLVGRGHRVVVVAPGIKFKDQTGFDEEQGFEIFRIKSIPIKPLHPYFRIVYKANIDIKLERLVRSFKPNIIHIQNHFTLGKACLHTATKLDISIIGTNHFMPQNLLEYFPKVLGSRISHFMWNDFMKVYGEVDYVTTPSYAGLKILKEVGLEDRIEVISNGIDLERFERRPVKSSLFEKFEIKRDLPIFLFAGRLEKDKNIDLILRATSIVLKKKNVQVVIVGRGKDEREFKNLAKKLNLDSAVVFTGRIEQDYLRSMYSLADVYIGSGSAELQGIAVMEAMAAGLPVLALNAVALPELVQDGVNGFLFELNEEDLAEKMLGILGDKTKLRTMGKNSLEIIKSHDIRITIAKYEELYMKIISGGRRKRGEPQ